MPLIAASRPAGAFQTPRAVSVRAMMPATMPHGTNVSICAVAQRIGLEHAREIERGVSRGLA